MRLRSLILLLPLIALAACNSSGPKNDKRSATGEVLQGTTSDAMLPLGQLTSQPPLLPPTSKGPTTPEQAADQNSGRPSAIDAGSGTPDHAATPAPAITPAAPASTAP
jgi:hypothetical protein